MDTTRSRQSVAFVYGLPDHLVGELRPDATGPQVLSDRGVHVRSWSQVPSEFSGIIVETLLFDWFAVAYVPVDAQGRGQPNHRVVNCDHLYELERLRAAQLRALKDQAR